MTAPRSWSARTSRTTCPWPMPNASPLPPPRALSPVQVSFWKGDGVRVVNLEGPLATECPVSAQPLVFCIATEAWRSIADLATHWVIVNNHRDDRGVAGRVETVTAIQ